MFERIGPLIISLIIFGLAFLLKLDFSTLSDYKFVYSNVVSFSSIIIGFLITMVSILITLTNRKVMIKIREMKADNLLKYYFVCPIVTGLVLTIFSIILGIAFDDKQLRLSKAMLTDVWIFLSAYFVCTTLRIFIIMLKLLSRVHEEELYPESKKVKPKIDKVYFDTDSEEDTIK